MSLRWLSTDELRYELRQSIRRDAHAAIVLARASERGRHLARARRASRAVTAHSNAIHDELLRRNNPLVRLHSAWARWWNLYGEVL